MSFRFRHFEAIHTKPIKHEKKRSGDSHAWAFGDLLQNNFTFRQRIQEPFVVKFCPYSRVKNGDYSGVLLGSDQPSEALFQPYDSLGEVIFHEGISPSRLNFLYPGFHHRMCRHREGQFDHDHAAQSFALYIDTFPET